MCVQLNKQTNKTENQRIWRRKKKIIVRISGQKEGKNSEKISEIVEFRKKWVNVLGFLGKCPGLNKQTKNLSKFEEKKNYRSVFGKKSREIQWKLEKN